MLNRPSRHGLTRLVSHAASTVISTCQARVARHIRAVGLILALLALVGSGAAVWDMHRGTIAEASANMRDLSIVLAEQARRYVQVIDVLLVEVQRRGQEVGLRTPDDFRQRMAADDIHGFLSNRTRSMPQAAATALFDADGVLVNTSRDAADHRYSVGDRDYFQFARDHPDSGIIVGKSATGRGSGIMSIFLVRRISGPDGGFLGIAVAAVNVDYLLNLYRTISGERHLGVTLLRLDGAMLARYPSIAVNGQTMPAGSRWHAQVAAGGGTFRSPGYFSGKKAIVSATPLVDYPLVVNVSIPEKDVLAIWWRQSASMAGGGITLAAAFVTLFWLIGRHLHRQEQHNAALIRTADALRASETRLRDFAGMSSDWLWEQDAELRFTEISMDMPLLPWGDRPHIGKRRSEVNDTTLAPEQWAEHERVLLARESFHDFRFRGTGPDGQSHYISISGMPVHDVAGQFAGYRGTGRDITAKVEAEATLRGALARAEQAETLLRDAVDSISEGLVIYDHEDRFVMCNDTYRQIYAEGAEFLVVGATFEAILRGTLAKRTNSGRSAAEAEWLTTRLRQHKTAVGATEHLTGNGSCILVTDRRMKSGGIAGLRIDISALKQAQMALRDSERKLKTYAEMSADWFWEQDADLRFVHDSNIPLTTLPTDVGKTRWDFADPAMDPRRWEAHKADLAARRPFRDFRWERIGIDGVRRYLSTNGDPILNARGDFIGYHGTGRDISSSVRAATELHEAKDRAEQAESLLQDAVDSMSEGVVIYDSQDRLILCNDAYRRLYPASASHMAPGVQFEALVRNSLKAGHYPDAIGREDAWLASFMDAHRAADSEIEVQASDGRWALVTERRMANGGIAGLRIDITALKQTQAALVESEERLDRAQSIAGIGSWELDVGTKRYIWSKELYRIRGLSPDEFQPTMESIKPYLHPDSHDVLEKWIGELMQGRGDEVREVKIVRPDGKVRLLRVEGRPVMDADGAIRRISGTMQDVTERRLIEQQLSQAQKMEAIGNLTGGMAHDFNNGLGVIIGNLDLLGRMVRSDGSATEVCDEAREAALRCADLIRGLLAFARRQPLTPRELDVNALIQETTRLLNRTLGQTIEIKLHLDATLCPAIADAAQLQSAVVNLAMNARDAMPRGGQLDIRTRNTDLDAEYAAHRAGVIAGSYVLIEISDAGTGISPEIIGQIFEPFFTTKESGRGTGLGLAMVFGFVKQSGGHLDVYSEPGHGTTFRMYLPRAEANETLALPASRKRPIVGGHETILVVEDNPQLRQVAVKQLTGLGYRVVEAENAAVASCILLSEARIDVLFTDVVMPGEIDGIGLAHRAIDLRPGLPVLLASGFPTIRVPGQRTLPAEFLFLGKPYRTEELARAVRDVLDGRTTQVTAVRRDVLLMTEET